MVHKNLYDSHVQRKFKNCLNRVANKKYMQNFRTFHVIVGQIRKFAKVYPRIFGQRSDFQDTFSFTIVFANYYSPENSFKEKMKTRLQSTYLLTRIKNDCSIEKDSNDTSIITLYIHNFLLVKKKYLLAQPSFHEKFRTF